MSTRDRITAAAQAILDAGTGWEAYLASLGTIAQQAQHFDISRATMTKLRNLRKRASEALEAVVAGVLSVDECHRGPYNPRQKAACEYCKDYEEEWVEARNQR